MRVEVTGLPAVTPNCAITVPVIAQTERYPLSIQVLAPSVASGGSVPLRIENQGTVTLGFNLCMDGILERSVGGGWVEVPRGDVMCTMMLSLLEPGKSAELGFGLPPGVPAGSYRLRVKFSTDPGGQTVTRRSNSFTVS